jgi:hypothetical protein
MKELFSFSKEIAEEHYNITKNVDSSINFLWHMYYKGTKAGNYEKFIFMAEMNLLKELGYTNDEEITNMIKMMDSEDNDNFNIVFLSLKNLRNQRIKDHKVCTSQPTFVYMPIIESYLTKVLSIELFKHNKDKQLSFQI